MKAFILQNEIPQNMHIMSRNEQINISYIFVKPT